MILPRGSVVSLRRGNFVAEAPEKSGLAVDFYCCSPAFIVDSPRNTFVPRPGSCGRLSSVTAVLAVRCRAEVGLSVVQAIVVYMVNAEAGGGFEYLLVHANAHVAATFWQAKVPACITGTPIGYGIPFIFV